MRILFTGGSSFTGYRFVEELSSAGHQVTATFQSKLEAYTGIRLKRVERLLQHCRPVFECSFGSSEFLQTIHEAEGWDVLCHHAADVTNYKSPDFDVARAVAGNTRGLTQVLDGLAQRGCNKIVMTGSVFEQNEGAGPELWKAFSPYGLSKGFTAEIIRHHTSQRGFKLGKFVIPNPFGPYEDPRFTTYLIQNWAEGKVPAVNTPAYVRDNIPVSLLAKAYRHFVENLHSECPRFERFNPTGYVESQGDFALRFAREMQARLGIPCAVDLKVQTQFAEPKMRINTESAAT
jgi:nucleoside-diphosphate-sugar epimerase